MTQLLGTMYTDELQGEGGCLLEEKVVDHLWREVWILPGTRLLQLVHVQGPLSRLAQIQQLQ